MFAPEPKKGADLLEFQAIGTGYIKDKNYVRDGVQRLDFASSIEDRFVIRQDGFYYFEVYRKPKTLDTFKDFNIECGIKHTFFWAQRNVETDQIVTGNWDLDLNEDCSVVSD